MKFCFSNYIDTFVEYCKSIPDQYQSYEIKRRIANPQSKAYYMNCYITLFIMTSMMIKAVGFLVCQCLFSNDNNVAISKIPRLEKRIRKFLECKFNKKCGSAYMISLTVCEVLVLIAVYMQIYQLTYPWLCIMAITLVGELCFIIKNINICRPAAVHLLIFAHVSYSWYYIYLWENK